MYIGLNCFWEIMSVQIVYNKIKYLEATSIENDPQLINIQLLTTK